MPVLLVDDRPANLLVLEAILSDPDYELVRVSSGRAALRALRERDFAVVLLDVVMPEMDGFEVMRSIRGLSSRTPSPVILVTGEDGARASVLEAYAGGVVDFIQKPVDPVVIRSKVSVFADLYRARREAARRAVEHAASEQRFHQLVDAVSDYAIFMLDPAGHVATWNLGAQKTKGYSEDEIVGKHFSVFYTPGDLAASKPQRILEAVRREGRFEDEGWRVRKDGSLFWANVVITALRDPNGELTGFVKVTRDLTARRVAEEREHQLLREQVARAASERAREELERLSRAKDEFLATMSHELRTPLNAITGWASILRKKPREEHKLDQGLAVIERNAKTQAKLIGDLLDVSRIITGKLRLSPVRSELYPLIVGAADVVRPAADAKGVRLVVDVDPEIGATMADPERLHQILWNLLANAVRFTPKGGRVTLTADRGESSVILRVQDTGAGIASEDLERVFDRFVQLDSSTTRAHGGMGLGLAIVRHLVEAHGGTVTASSEGLGRGATFTVTLPIAAVATAADAAATEPSHDQGAQRDEHAPGPTLEGVRVLAIEDDPDSLEILCTVLRSQGAQVAAAASAGEAVKALEAGGPFDVIVSDIGMPEMDGYTLMQRIRSGGPTADVPAIALTAYARSEDAERARRAGFQEHLAKPVEERRLLAVVSALTQKGSARNSDLH